MLASAIYHEKIKEKKKLDELRLENEFKQKPLDKFKEDEKLLGLLEFNN